jgi:diguanylate cyclase (GGDEF)-like protein
MDAKANTRLCLSPVPLDGIVLDPRAEVAESAYFIVVGGGVPGTMLRLGDSVTTLGRSSENSIPLTDITISRWHAEITNDRDRGLVLIDQGSTNGTFVNGSRIPSRKPVIIKDGDRVQLGTKMVLKLVRLDATDERFQREMFERTVRDGLTGLYNRAYFLSQLESLGDRCSLQGIGLAVMMLDVDHFKAVNDRFGHPTGDLVLKEVAAVIRESTRSEDLVARYGGEEFVVAVPAASIEHAAERAERVRWSLASRKLSIVGTDLRVTVSIGLSFGSPTRLQHALALLVSADQAMYQSKLEGRNRVSIVNQSSHMLAAKETESADFGIVPLKAFVPGGRMSSSPALVEQAGARQ